APRVIARTRAVLPPSKTRRTAAAHAARFPRWRPADEGPSWHRLLVTTLDRRDRPGDCMRAARAFAPYRGSAPSSRAVTTRQAAVAGDHPPARRSSAGGDPEGAFFASVVSADRISVLDRSCQNKSSARSAKTHPRALKCEPGSVTK